MRIFHCDKCGNLVFFENSRCVACGHDLAFLPDRGMVALEPVIRSYRPCRNYTQENVCNWAVPADDPDPLCASCRLTRVIPDLGPPGRKEAWFKIEMAKRRLIYGLLALRLPLDAPAGPGTAPAFEFKADAPDAPVLTGHNQGLITLNIAEADDAERERRRAGLGEPYRTLLGHFRHEIGHYYWDRLISGSGDLEGFRRLFGDEREDYGEALRRHYSGGAPADWNQRCVSAYASSHPWEDWAETWAHYLHMHDSLETAAACGLSLKPKRADEPALKPPHPEADDGSFDRLLQAWFPLTYVLNNLNRGMGLPDGYPFVLSPPAQEKLRFVHGVIAKAAVYEDAAVR